MAAAMEPSGRDRPKISLLLYPLAQKAGKLSSESTAVSASCSPVPRGSGSPVCCGSHAQINAMIPSVPQPKYMRWLCAWRMAV